MSNIAITAATIEALGAAAGVTAALASAGAASHPIPAVQLAGPPAPLNRRAIAIRQPELVVLASR